MDCTPLGCTLDEWGEITYGDAMHTQHGIGVTHLNIAGLTREKLHRLLTSMRRGEVGIFFLTDIRCTGSELPFWRKHVKEALGPRATLLMAPVSNMKGHKGPPKVGGCAVILNDYWGGRQCDWFQDDTGLGVVLGVYLTLLAGTGHTPAGANTRPIGLPHPQG